VACVLALSTSEGEKISALDAFHGRSGLARPLGEAAEAVFSLEGGVSEYNSLYRNIAG